MNYTILASGSRGNSTVIESNGHTILIDCGIPSSELYSKLEELNISIEQIEAVLITHEHIDHIRSIQNFDFAKIYSSQDTLANLNSGNILFPFQEYLIAGFKITPIPLSHDCNNPIGYIVKDEKESLVYMTDTGYVKEKYFQYITNATHYIFESNHDVKMLLHTNRPYYLKRRIMSMEGHLSNDDAAIILSRVIGDRTKSLRLAHISEDANTKELAYDTLISVFEECGISYGNISIEVADRYQITKGMNDFEDE